jgi:hypothetical protein
LKSLLGYCDLEALHTSPSYLENLWKTLFAMIRQIGSPTFFCNFYIWRKIMGSSHRSPTHLACLKKKSLKQNSRPSTYSYNIIDMQQSYNMCKILWS